MCLWPQPVTFGPSNLVLDHVDVLLASWIGGEEHGPAMWSILNGDFNPSGRLAQTWPRRRKCTGIVHRNVTNPLAG